MFIQNLLFLKLICGDLVSNIKSICLTIIYMYAMCLTSVTDYFDDRTVSIPLWCNDRAAPTDTNPKNLELASSQSVTASGLAQLAYSPELSHSFFFSKIYFASTGIRTLKNLVGNILYYIVLKGLKINIRVIKCV